MSITGQVRNSLHTSAQEIRELNEKVKEIDSKIQSNRYSDYFIKSNLEPERAKIRKEIEKAKEAAIKRASDIVDRAINEYQSMDELNPEALTDDVKILDLGRLFTLTEKDLLTIIARDPENTTMRQIVTRYAAEHDLDLGKEVKYFGHAQEIRRLTEFRDTVAMYFPGWAENPNVDAMIEEAFAGEVD